MNVNAENGYSLEYVIKTSAGERPSLSSSMSSSDSSHSASSMPPCSSRRNIIPAVMDEADVLSFSCSRSSLGKYKPGAKGGRISPYKKRDHGKSVSGIEDEFEEIQERNQIKRLEHATTYVNRGSL